jgi:hypothetical protein
VIPSWCQPPPCVVPPVLAIETVMSGLGRHYPVFLNGISCCCKMRKISVYPCTPYAQEFALLGTGVVRWLCNLPY